MSEIIPTIIAHNYEELEKMVRTLEPLVGRAHIDIMDGLFVGDKTIGPDEIDRLETELSLEVHLMVQKPENHIRRWLQTRADKFLAHAEATSKMLEVIGAVREADLSAPLDVSRLIFGVLNPETDHAVLADYIDELDGVQLMSVHPGRYGAEFLPEVAKKIQDFHYFYPDMTVQVDGGITPKTLPTCAQAGASIFAVGSYIWKSGNLEKAIADLQSLL